MSLLILMNSLFTLCLLQCKLLEQHLERGELLKEYESIPRRHPAGECVVAQQPESSDKNRFQDVLPYDSTRVELVPTKENNTGYINASHIKVSCAATYCALCMRSALLSRSL